MTVNGWKLLKIVGNQWFEMVRNDWEWLEMVRNGQICKSMTVLED